MDLATLGLSVNSGGAVSALQKFTFSAHNAGKAGGQLEKGLGTLGRAFGGFTALLSIRQLAAYADTWQLIHNRINLVTNDTQTSMTIQQKLYEISQRTRNSMEATSVLYTRLALSANELGRSHQDLLDVTESVNAAMLRGGATGVEAAQSMRQLAQAFSKGKLDGDEFRTVMEAMPEVANAIMQELKVTKGELYELSRAGKITTNDMIDALLAARARYVASIEDMPITFSQAWIVLSNAVERLVGIFAMAIKTSTHLGNSLKWVIDHLNQLIALVVAVTSAYMAYRAALFLLISVYELYLLWKKREVVIEGILTALRASSVKGFLTLAAGIAAVSGGFYIYHKLLAKIESATAKWTDANVDLNEVLGEYKSPIDQKAVDEITKVRHEIEDMIRLARQQVQLSGLEERAARRMQIEFNAINKTVQARRDLSGQLLKDMERAILLERDLLLYAEEVQFAREAAEKALEEQMKIIEEFAKNLQRSMADVFYKIFNDGINTFGDLFRGIKSMFMRMLADMLAAEMMKKIGSQLASIVGGVFTNRSKIEAPPSSVQTEAEVAEILRRAQSNPDLNKTPTSEDVVKMDAIVAAAKPSTWARIAKYATIAMAGFGVGQMIGGMTANRTVGLIGGAMGGAAAGFAMGGVPGAAVGALAGAIGGLMGASAKHKEELRLHREVLAKNNERLYALRQTVYGSTAGTEIRRAETLAGRYNSVEEVMKAFAASYFKGDKTGIRELIELKLTAKRLGIELDDSKESMAQLREAIALTIIAMTQWGRNLTDIQKRQEAYNKIFDIPESPMRTLADSYAILTEMAPDLMRQMGLANLDLTSEIGRTVLKEGFKDIFNLIASGQLTPDMLGAFSDKNQLIDSILTTVDALNAFNKELYKVTTDFPRAMDIIYYEQKFGRYGQANTNRIDGQVSAFKIDNVTIVNEAGDTGEVLLNKLESAAYVHESRGGVVAL